MSVSVSRGASLLSAIGAAIALSAVAYSSVALERLGRERVIAAQEVAELKEQSAASRLEVSKYRAEAASARKALSASRAAINAFHANRYEDAVSLYDEALSADSENAYIENLRAYALFKLRRYDEAIAGARRSVAADPNYAWGYFDLARFLCATRPSAVSEAKESAARAIQLRPDMSEVMKRDGEFQRVCGGKVP